MNEAFVSSSKVSSKNEELEKMKGKMDFAKTNEYFELKQGFMTVS
jgi:hypothetical protein